MSKIWYLSNDGNIGLATSPDGVIWTKHAGNPILSEGWDGVGINTHTVITESGSFKMWLSSGTGDSFGIGYAESTDGISWTMSISNPVLISGTPGQWGEPVVRFNDGSDGSVLNGFTVTGGEGEFAGGRDGARRHFRGNRPYVHSLHSFRSAGARLRGLPFRACPA